MKRRGLVQYRMRLVVVPFVLLLARPALAQTRFVWPSDTGDVSRYTSVEECLAAATRVRGRSELRGPVWSDTLALTPERAKAPLPASVRETARRCSVRFVAQTAPVTEMLPLMSLYLLAGRDVDAETILRRRLAGISPAAQRERVAILDSALCAHLWFAVGSLWTSPQPVLLATAESLLVEVARLPDSLHTVEARLTPAFQFFRAAKVAGDTARVRRAAERFLDLTTRLSSADRRTQFFQQFGSMLVYLTLSTQQQVALVDSLKRGTAGYVALQRAAWAKSSGESPTALHFPIGEHAPGIEGNFWFRRGDSSATRPTKGRVSLAVFLDYDCRATSNGKCWPAYASLHRLAQRFPAVQVTVMARTHGYFSGMAPPPVSLEADVLREWWQEFHQLPGALAVTATDSWKLDPPDGRRIDRTTLNVRNYSFGRSWEVKPGMAFLIDQDGIIVDVGNLGAHDEVGTPDVEQHLGQLIEILLARTP